MTEIEKTDAEGQEDIDLTIFDDGADVDADKAVAEAKKWKAIAERKTKKLDELQKQATKPQSPEVQPEKADKPGIDEDEYRELRLDGYSKEEAEFILANGGRQALSDAESFAAAAISAKREKQRALEEASKVPDTGGSDIERKYTKAQLDAMSAEELEKVLSSQS